MTTKFVDSFLSNFAYETIDNDTRMLTTGVYKGICVRRDGKISGENFKIEVKEFKKYDNLQMYTFSCCIPVPLSIEEYDTEIEDKTQKEERLVVRNLNMIQLWLIHALVWYDDETAWIEGNECERGKNFAAIAFMRMFKNKKYCKFINSMYRKCDPTKEYLFPLEKNAIFNLAKAICYRPSTRGQMELLLNKKVDFKMIAASKAFEDVMNYASERMGEDSVYYSVAEMRYLDYRVWFYEEFKNSLESIREEYNKYAASMEQFKKLKWTMC